MKNLGASCTAKERVLSYRQECNKTVKPASHKTTAVHEDFETDCEIQLIL